FDTYTQLALLASLAYSALALSEAAPSAQTSLGFFSLPIQLSRNALRSVLVGATFVFGMLSGTTLDQIHRALRHLASDRALLVAACGFPSLATNVDTLARRLPVLAPPVLIILASMPTVWAAEAAAWGGFGLLAVVVSIPFFFRLFRESCGFVTRT